jgi:hypothetical protein
MSSTYMQHIKVKKKLVVINTAIITDIFNKNWSEQLKYIQIHSLLVLNVNNLQQNLLMAYGQTDIIILHGYILIMK